MTCAPTSHETRWGGGGRRGLGQGPSQGPGQGSGICQGPVEGRLAGVGWCGGQVVRGPLRNPTVAPSCPAPMPPPLLCLPLLPLLLPLRLLICAGRLCWERGKRPRFASKIKPQQLALHSRIQTCIGRRKNLPKCTHPLSNQATTGGEATRGQEQSSFCKSQYGSCCIL